MTDFSVALQVPPAGDKRQVDYGIRAEALGYEAFWAGELWDADLFVVLARIASETEALNLGTAIANVFSRTPAVLAMAGTTLQRESGRRVTLGVGPSTPTAIQNIHGLDYDRPLEHVRETAKIIKRLTGGNGRVDYEGPLYSLKGVPAIDRELPVYNGAVGPKNRYLTGRFCDGWIPHNIPFPSLEEAFETVADGAREEDRSPDDITITPLVPAVAAESEADARRELKRHIAYYVGSAESYRRPVARLFPDRAETVAEHWQHDRHRQAAEAVGNEMVGVLGIAGTPDQAREQLQCLLEDTIIDMPVLMIPRPVDRDTADSTVEALAPETL